MSSDNDDEQTEVPDFRDFLAPWNNAFGSRVLTCSPVRKGIVICMDISCKHDSLKKRLGGHDGSMKATPLEMVVINSFTGIDPREMTGSNEFVGWSQNELHFACYGTDSVENVSKRMFDDRAMLEKLRTYVSTFEGAAEMFRRSEELLQEDDAAAIMQCVNNWSGGMNPLLYLWCMKGRCQQMTSKIVRLKNTVGVWKEEYEKAKRETAQLKWKLKYQKKTGSTT